MISGMKTNRLSISVIFRLLCDLKKEPFQIMKKSLINITLDFSEAKIESDSEDVSKSTPKIKKQNNRKSYYSYVWSQFYLKKAEDSLGNCLV
jgi:hypothetical protein